MKILALEFSSDQRSVAILDKASNLPPQVRASVILTHGRTTPAIAMIDQAIREAGIPSDAIDLFAVGLGPGSYTGIRMAIALVQGWNLAQPVQTAGLASTLCLAEQAREFGWQGRAHFVVDAQRGDVYHTSYDFSDSTMTETRPLQIVPVEALKLWIAPGDRVAGPEVQRWFPSGYPLFPQAATLGKLIAVTEASLLNANLEPIYLRETSFVKAPPTRVIPDVKPH